MKARWQSLKKRYWNSRAATERRAIMLGALAVAPLLLYFLLWQPPHQATPKLRIQVPDMRAEAAHLHTQVSEAEALRHHPIPAVLDSSALKTSIEDSAVRHKMREALTSLEVQPPNSVRITLAAVSFEQWLNWLRNLQQEQHIRAESVGIAALPQTGTVKISATLTNGSAQ